MSSWNCELNKLSEDSEVIPDLCSNRAWLRTSSEFEIAFRTIENRLTLKIPNSSLTFVLVRAGTESKNDRKNYFIKAPAIPGINSTIQTTPQPSASRRMHCHRVSIHSISSSSANAFFGCSVQQIWQSRVIYATNFLPDSCRKMFKRLQGVQKNRRFSNAAVSYLPMMV